HVKAINYHSKIWRSTIVRAHLQQAFLFIWHGKCRISPDKGGHWEIVEPTKQEKDNIIKKINPT
ncbi:MAG: hypothetical protein II525_03105, partial [Bacteroidales bacterium]|nr:hypothetical protein [Bacteroidales bacterium]